LWYDYLLLRMLLPVHLLPAHPAATQRPRGRKVLLATMSEPVQVTDDTWQSLGAELRGFVRARVRCDADADDLLQDVYLRMLEKISSLRNTERLESWVYQIARNAIADFYRRASPRPGRPVEDIAGNVAVQPANNNNHAVGAWLSAAIDRLPKTLREAVRMYEIEGQSQDKIARTLQISLSGAKSRIQRGRRRLAELLHNCCQLELDRRGNVLECTPSSDASCPPANCARNSSC
jgi:RNA polymerase sigma-70 factor (ECF subfamily)